MDKKENLNSLFKLIKQCSDIPGVPGRETRIAEFVVKQLKPYVEKTEIDNMGSVISWLHKKDESLPTILLDAHMDEIGFLISKIEDNGFIKFVPVGGWWGHVLLGQRLRITTRNNDEIVGVVGSKPPHILPPEERNNVVKVTDMYLDIGLTSKKDVESLGIKVGDSLSKDSFAFRPVNSNFVFSKAIDNRVSVAILLEMARILKPMKLHANICFSFTVQEEVGLRGAITATNIVKPNMAFVVDTTLSHDQPGMEANDCKMDNGVALEVLDAYSLSNQKLLHYSEKLCDENNIKYSYSCLTGGGTNGGSIYKWGKGVPLLGVAIPSRYLHSHNEMCSLNDVASAIDFLTKIIPLLTKSKIDELSSFDDSTN